MLVGLTALLVGLVGTFAAIGTLAAEHQHAGHQYAVLGMLILLVITAFHISVQALAYNQALLDSIARSFICG